MFVKLARKRVVTRVVRQHDRRSGQQKRNDVGPGCVTERPGQSDDVAFAEIPDAHHVTPHNLPVQVVLHYTLRRAQRAGREMDRSKRTFICVWPHVDAERDR